MQDKIRIKKCVILPNGVDTILFRPVEKKVALERIGWETYKKHVFFPAHPARYVKNFQLLQKAFEAIDSLTPIELHTLENTPHQEVPFYMNASDVVILTSLWEGSPNVIKEAMACSRPVISTDVGDVRWLFGQEPGHFLTSFDPEEIAAAIKVALNFSDKFGRTNGRERIIELGLDSESVAKQIVALYESVLERRHTSVIN
jgi:glycosyltransferase involved in cell wall biosynthesis